MPTTQQHIGAKLKAARLAHNLTTREVGAYLNITIHAVYFFETGRNGVNIDKLADLCRLYGVKFKDVLPEEMHELLGEVLQPE